MKLIHEGVAYIKPNLIGPGGHLRDKWEVIEELIIDYTKLHGDEVAEVLDAATDARMSKKHKDASMDHIRLRHALVLPVGLNFLIKRHFPEVLKPSLKGEPGFLYEFMKRFPQFAVPDNI